MAEVSINYGPQGPVAKHYYNDYTTPTYLKGMARKIILDLEKVARLYSGKKIRLYKFVGEERCSTCTNILTGEILSSSCPECNGTGFKKAWEEKGDFWAYVDLNPEEHVATEMGITMNPNGGKETFIIIGAPTIEDQDFFVSIETKKVYKVYNAEPRAIAMGGTVVAQAAEAGDIEDGSPEHKVIDW